MKKEHVKLMTYSLFSLVAEAGNEPKKALKTINCINTLIIKQLIPHIAKISALVNKYFYFFWNLSWN